MVSPVLAQASEEERGCSSLHTSSLPNQMQQCATLTTLPQLQQLWRTTWSETTRMLLVLNQHTQCKQINQPIPNVLGKQKAQEEKGRESERKI